MLISIFFFSKSLALQKGVSVGIVYITARLIYVQKSKLSLAFATSIICFSIPLLTLRPSKQMFKVLGRFVLYYAASFAYKLPAIGAT